MIMKNIASSLLLLMLISGCENKAEPLEDDVQIAPQEQHEQGHIETHSTE